MDSFIWQLWIVKARLRLYNVIDLSEIPRSMEGFARWQKQQISGPESEIFRLHYREELLCHRRQKELSWLFSVL